MSAKTAAAVAAPSLGPAVITIFGQDVPLLAYGLACTAMILARFIAPPAARKLTRRQEAALTVLLAIVLFLVVTGAFTSTPLAVGMAVTWGIGLGFSGLLVVEFFGTRVMAMLEAMTGAKREPPSGSDGPTGP